MKKRIEKLLKSVFGYDEFRDLQEKVILNVLEGKDTLAVMPTGSGKSLCYQIPALVFDGISIVVSPLISLMKDQVDQVREVGIDAAFLNSSLDSFEYEDILSDLSKHKYKLLYVAPETLLIPRILSVLQKLNISMITVDEAHCISEWGHDFRPEYRQLSILRDMFPKARILALTATATDKVRNDISRILRIDSNNVMVSSFNRPNLFLEVRIKTDISHQIVNYINQYPNQSGIIYCATRKQVDNYTAILQSKGYSALPYHAGLTDSERAENQVRFSKDDVSIMVATIAFGMGINKPNVRFILHTGLPKNIETYYQQIGRAGRDGEDAWCLLLYNYGDIAKIKYLFKDKDEAEVKHEMALLQKMIGYCEADICRRILLLRYFGEHYNAQGCSNCDNCTTSNNEKEDLTIHVQKYLSCIWRTNQIFGANHIINVLRGSKDKKVLENQHDKLSTYGIGTDLSKKQWLELNSKLISASVIIREPQYGSLQLTEEAWKILKGNKKYLGKLHKEQKIVKVKPDDLDFDHELFDILRKLRKDIADERGVPPFVILPDKSLKELSFYYPQSLDSLITMHGFGEIKCKNYGEKFISVISEYAGQYGKSEIKKGEVKKRDKRYIEVGEMYNKGVSLPMIAKNYNVSKSTIVKHLKTYIDEGLKLKRELNDDDKIIEPENYKEIAEQFDKYGTDFLKPVYVAFEGRIDYKVLRIARFIYQIRTAVL